jgi:hypothetical protein
MTSGTMKGDMISPSRNVMANESRSRLLGGTTFRPPHMMKAVIPPSLSTFHEKPLLVSAQASKGKSLLPATWPPSTRKTRSDTKNLPGKPERLVEQVILSTPKKKATRKTTPKKTATKKVAAPKAIKPEATKVTKKSPAKPKAKSATVKKAAASGKKVIAVKGKGRPRTAEEPPPSPVCCEHPSELDEGYKRGVYRASEGWFDLRRMTYLDDEEVGRTENPKGRGIDAYLSR